MPIANNDKDEQKQEIFERLKIESNLFIYYQVRGKELNMRITIYAAKA